MNDGTKTNIPFVEEHILSAKGKEIHIKDNGLI
jgi:hypothetical protein